MTLEAIGVLSSILFSVAAFVLSWVTYRRDSRWKHADLRQVELDRLEAAYWELDALVTSCVHSTVVDEGVLPEWTFRQPTTRRGRGNQLLNGAALKVYDLWLEVALKNPGEERLETLKSESAGALQELRRFIVEHRGDW